MNNIYYRNGVCGSGKTTHSIQDAIKLIGQGQPVCIVGLHSDLIKQTQEEFKKRHRNPCKYPSRVIDPRNNKGTVCKAINKFLCSSYAQGLLLITHRAFKDVPIERWTNRGQWNVFIDEEMSDLINDLTIFCDPKQRFREAFLKHIKEIATVIPYVSDPNYMHFVWNTRFEKKTLENMRDADSFISTLEGHHEALIHPNYDLLCFKDDWNSFNAGTTNKLPMWSQFNLDCFKGFQSVTLLGAQINNSFMMKYMEKDANLTILPAINSEQYIPHQQSITIKWAVDRPTWSKEYYQKSCEHNKLTDFTNLEIYHGLVSLDVEDKEFLAQANKNTPWPDCIKNTIHMDFAVEGLNKEGWMNCDIYAESGAYNFNNNFKDLLNRLGFDHDLVQLNKTLSHCYQGATRSSLRKNGGTYFNNNIIYLPTKRMADLMHDRYFPNATVMRIFQSDEVYIDKKARTQVEYNYRSKIKKEFDQLLLPSAHQSTGGINNYISLSFFKAVSKRNAHCNEDFCSFDALATFMQGVNVCHYRKEDTPLFLNAVIPDDATGKQAEILRFNPIAVLDIDNCAASPDEFVAQFPNIRLICMPSFNHGKNTNKFRVIFELNKAPANSNQFRILMKNISDMVSKKVRFSMDTPMEKLTRSLRQRRMDGQNFNVDPASCKPAQLYYLPGINRDFAKKIFFINQSGQPIDINPLIETQEIPIIKMNIPAYVNGIPGPIQKRITNTHAGRHNEDYTKIIGFIQHNRGQFTDAILHDIYTSWTAVDPDKNRHGGFFKAINKTPSNDCKGGY